MTDEILPNDGRAIDLNSPTAKSIIEGVVPKAIRTWTVFKNTDNTLEGIEALAFAMWQVALDEIEKESDNVVFMSDNTVKLIKNTLERLKQENAELKAENERLKENDCEQCKHLDLYIKYKQTLQEIKAIAEKLMADNLCNNCDGIGLDANCQDTGCPYYQMDAILQKITKVGKE